jgi:phosphoesterase RecJ-like protein
VPFGVFKGLEEDGLGDADALVILDTGVPERLGRVAEVLPRIRALRVCIDHHVERETPADVYLVHPGASSTAELVYRLLAELSAEMEPALAIPLYVGITFDTGSFAFANTTRETHLIAADLYRYGVRPEELYARVFANASEGRMRIWGHALSGLAIEAGGRLAWMRVDRDALAATGAAREDLEGLVEQGRMVQGVELAILFREEGLEETKVSFRSKGLLDVNALAGRFGGGGHPNAAGAELRLPITESIEVVLAEARRTLEGTRHAAAPVADAGASSKESAA